MPGAKPPLVLQDYTMWTVLNRVGNWELTRMRNEASYFDYRPQISILVPVYDPESAWLRRALDSVMGQTYPHWELCVCDDGSSESYVREILGLYGRLDSHIKVHHLERNEGIVSATNRALSMASGEFCGLLDHDDELAPNALFEVVKFLQDHPDADLIYTDEDKIDESGGRVAPHFKIGWSPDLAMAANYLNHFSVYRRSVLEEVGGWREGFDGAQDLELVQRYGERTEKIYHIPKVLYHWRMTAGSTAVGADSKPYTHEKARRAVEDALERRGIAGSAQDGFAPNTFRIEREIIGEPRVSVVIPTTGEVSRELIESLRNRTSYPNYEILLLDLEKGTLSEHQESVEEQKTARQLGSSTPAELLDAAVRRTEGEYVLILDPCLEAASDGWLEKMLQHAQRPEVGAVGGKLLLPSGHVFQAGLFLLDEAKSEAGDGRPRLYRYCDQQATGYRHFWDLARNCSAVSSDCIMFRKNVFEDVGGFDSAHFSEEFADVDLCLRMWESGYLIVYTPYAEFIYRSTPSRRPGLGPDEAGYARRRWGAILENDPYYNPILSWQPRDPLPSTPALAREVTDAPAAPQVTSSSQETVDFPPPFFIVGYGRSGTTWLEQTLNSHPEVLCKGSGMFFGRNMRLYENQRTLHAVLANSEDLKTWHDMRPNYWSEHPFEEDLPGMVRALADHTMGTELAKTGKKIAGDRTPHHVKYLEEIHDLYPDSKIIHIIRDGRDVAISNIHAVWQNARDRGGPVDLEPEVVEKRDAYLKDREAFLRSGESIFTDFRIKQLARSWNETVSEGREDGQRLFGENYFEIRYEDLLENPHSELQRVFGFLGAERDPDIIGRVIEDNTFEKITGRSRGQEDPSAFHRKGVAGDWKEVFNERDRRVFEEMAGELLTDLGYENSGAPARTRPPIQAPPDPSPTPPVPAPKNVRTTPPPFFVVGHGRSGTTWSERLLNSHPEVLCKGSGMFFGRDIGLFEGRKTLYATLANSEDLKIWHDMLPNYWSERPFEEDVPGMVKALADRTMKTALDESGKKIVGDRTPHYVSYLEEVHDLYPASKIIHVIRDGRDVAISNMHAFWSSARDRGGPIDLAPEELERRDAYLKDREAFLKSGESIFTESRIRQLSGSWNRLINKARNDGQKLFGDRYMEIRYERLLEEPHTELGDVFAFLDVGRDRQMMDRIVEENSFEKVAGRARGQEDSSVFHRKGVVGDWEEVFNERDKRVFKEEAGELLMDLGYEKDMSW